MTLLVRFSDEAIDDFEEIEAYIGRDSFESAMRVIVRIHGVFSTLADMPYLGKSSEAPNARKIAVRKSRYIIVYETREKELWILRVYHGARNMPY